MRYQEFKDEYIKTYNQMMKYQPNMAGAGIYAGRLADLSDGYPDYEEMLEEELFQMERSL